MARLVSTRIIDNNDPGCYSGFEPFDDTVQISIGKRTNNNKAVTAVTGASDYHEVVGMDTSGINQFRQGVEITTQAYRFAGVGPKLWSGNIKGCTTIRTIGQTSPFTESEDDKKFTDKQKFNPVEYVNNSSYPLPVYLNDGPQQKDEASVQAFSIPFWNKNNEEVVNRSHSVYGAVEDGNRKNTVLHGENSRIEQFIDLRQPSGSFVPFLDEGQSYYGIAPTACLPTSGAYALFTFDNTIADKLGNVTLDYTSGTLVYSRGPGQKSPLPPETNALVYRKSVVDTSVGGPVLSASAYIPTLDSASISVQGLVYMPRNLYYDDTQSHYFAVQEQQVGVFITTPYYDSNWRFAFAGHPTDGTQRKLYVAGASGLSGDSYEVDFSGSGGLDEAINLDAWNHIAFTRRSGSGNNVILELWANGVLGGITTASFLGKSGSSIHRLVLGGTEYFDTFSSPYGAVAFTGDGLRLSCLKFSPYRLTPTEILTEVSQAFINATSESYKQEIVHEGYLNDDCCTIAPFSDLGDAVYINQLNGLSGSRNNSFRGLLESTLNINIDNDLRGIYGIKSAAAGYDGYGPGIASLGTDSIAFQGLIRGSEPKKLPVYTFPFWNLLTFTNASERYIPDGPRVFGPYAANVPATTTISGVLYLQVEEQRTNIVTQSNTLDNSGDPWGKVSVTAIIPNSMSSPIVGESSPTADVVDYAPSSTGRAEETFVSGSPQSPFGFNATTVQSVYAMVTGSARIWRFRPVLYDGSAPGGATNYEATTTWQRFTGSFNVAAGAANLAYRLMNKNAAEAGQVAYSFTQWESGSYATSPIITTSGAQTRQKDQCSISYVDSPDFLNGAWSVTVRPDFTSDVLEDNSTKYIFYIDANNYLKLTKSAGLVKITCRVASSSTISSALTFTDPEQFITITVDIPNGQMTIAGATTGNGTSNGTMTGWPQGTLYVGHDSNYANHWDGLIGEAQLV